MNELKTSIAPWLSVTNGKKAVEFYSAAFNAIETYRLEDDGVFIVRLSVNGAEFWVNEITGENTTLKSLQSDYIRMILTVSNPEELFSNAIKAGAEEIFPVGEDHGWKIGRIEDPFGMHWEIGHPV